jgi:hypothetical protein
MSPSININSSSYQFQRENDFGARNVEPEKPKQKQVTKRDRIKKAKAERSEKDAPEIHSAKSLTLNVN